MAVLRTRSFDAGGTIRTFRNGYTSVVQIGETAVGYGVYEPGFRWSVDLAPLAGSPTCPLHHIGYAISGMLHVTTDAGQELDIVQGCVYEIPPGHDGWVVGDEPFVTIDWAAARAWRPVSERAAESVIATILLTDIVDSTATLRRLGDQAWAEQLALYHARMREHLNDHRGREVDATGDSLLAVFDHPIQAVRCSEAMAATSRAMGLPIRIGIHSGEVELIGEGARGLAVHMAARVMALGGPDDVVISSTTRDLLEGSGVAIEDHGEHELKGLPGRRRVFRLRR